MVKTVLLCSMAICLLCAEEKGKIGGEALQKECLQCHIREQIPSSLIYRRYLMRYSTPERIENAMFQYLKHPKKEHSIMPRQFFLKFPMKVPIEMDNDTLREYIALYRETFDVKKMLQLP